MCYVCSRIRCPKIEKPHNFSRFSDSIHSWTDFAQVLAPVKVGIIKACNCFCIMTPKKSVKIGYWIRTSLDAFVKVDEEEAQEKQPANAVSP
jgi:thermostable 8-oxoguanine DNA glycosylase